MKFNSLIFHPWMFNVETLELLSIRMFLEQMSVFTLFFLHFKREKYWNLEGITFNIIVLSMECKGTIFGS